MTITFYLLLTYLNLTGKRKSFVKKNLEKKMNWFFGIYSFLWLLMVGSAIFFYFVSIPIFISCLVISLWLIAEQITDHAILIKGKNKIILQKEFMSVDKESLKEAETLNNLNKNHHK
jgi:hypothetical protein